MSNYSYPPEVPLPPPPPKKSNKTLWIVLGSIAAVVVLACCGVGSLVFLADDDESGKTNASGDNDDGGAEAADDEGEAAKVGDTVTDGTFEFTVEKVEDGVSDVGDEYLNKKASGEFTIVHVTVKNVGDAAELFSDTEQKVVDAEGKEYDADSEAGIYIKDNDALLENINPGNEITAQLVFDTPADVTLDHVLLFGSFGSDGVAVAL